VRPARFVEAPVEPRGSLEDPFRRKRLKERGVVLATTGLLLGIGVGLALKLMGLARLSYVDLILALAVTFVLQSVAWWVPHMGWDHRLTWDPHYLYTPMVLAALQLNFYLYLAPEARFIVPLGWFVALLFMVGLAGFLEVVALNTFMMALYLTVLDLARARGALASLELEHMFACFFLAVSVYVGVVFERLRNERKEMARLRAQLAELAATDGLTGLPNRRHWETLLEMELTATRRYGGHCSVAMIDVDFFKSYNDTWGHLAGDAALKELAQVMRERLRATDVLARYGGEEFALIMRRTPRDEAFLTVERLREVVAAHVFSPAAGQPGAQLTISAGVSAAPEHGLAPEELLRRADQALYAAKRLGRNRTELVELARA
jgi:diguanylate cyclase (GGDEF)-like protein